MFTEAGFSVSSARVVRRRWGHPRKSKGYGFVELEDETQQQAAMSALQNKEIGTGKEARQIAIKVAVNLPAEETEEGEEKAPAAEGGQADGGPSAKERGGWRRVNERWRKSCALHTTEVM